MSGRPNAEPGRRGPLRRRRDRRRAKKARLAAMGWGRRWARRALILSTWLLGLVAAMMIAAIVLYQTVADVQRPESLPLAQVATIQYSDGTTLARIGTVDRVAVRLAQVPPHVRWAVLAAEDRGFYSEPGVSLRGTVRAALADATGSSTQGGSGITQQYVKNTYLSDSQTLSRKLKELMISLKLAREYSKDQILEFYLNIVYFGRGAYGIQAAARQFFGVDVAKLTVAQGALLAGMLRAPSYYDPAANPTAARQRWRYVLDGMVATKHLTPAQETALAFPHTRPESGSGLGVSGWKYLVKNAVLADLARHGISDREISERGLTIRTTIDRRAQQAAVRTIATTFGHLTAKQKNLKNALVAVNPRSGGVIAYYGGSGTDVKGYDGRVNYNDWVAQREPAGSAFKPYTLATALNQTVERTPGRPHLAIDSYVDGSYCRRIEGTSICNDKSDKTVSGPHVRLALAMKYSLNTTFDALASKVGPANVAATAHRMGVAAKDSAGHPTLVGADGTTTFGIGIGDYPVTPLDQATGFATLANKGVRNDAYLVTTATASDGEVVFRHRSSANRSSRLARGERRHQDADAHSGVFRSRLGERPGIGGEDRHRRHRRHRAQQRRQQRRLDGRVHAADQHRGLGGHRIPQADLQRAGPADVRTRSAGPHLEVVHGRLSAWPPRGEVRDDAADRGRRRCPVRVDPADGQHSHPQHAGRQHDVAEHADRQHDIADDQQHAGRCHNIAEHADRQHVCRQQCALTQQVAERLDAGQRSVDDHHQQVADATSNQCGHVGLAFERVPRSGAACAADNRALAGPARAGDRVTMSR